MVKHNVQYERKNIDFADFVNEMFKQKWDTQEILSAILAFKDFNQ